MKKISEMTIEERKEGYLKEWRKLIEDNQRFKRGVSAKKHFKKQLRIKWWLPEKGGIDNFLYET